MAKRRILSDAGWALQVRLYLDVAYKDYLAARVLINAGLLVQGAILASTAIEKYFKALLAFRKNQAHGHLSRKHWRSAFNFERSLATALDEDFLALLVRAYSLRYFDRLEQNFTIVIASREFLAELDHTALILQRSILLNRADGTKDRLDYDADLDAGDVRLLSNNHVLVDDDRRSFIARDKQLVYELRNCPKLGILEALYVAGPSGSDGRFTRGGMTPVSGMPGAYDFAFGQIEEGSLHATTSTPKPV